MLYELGVGPLIGKISVNGNNISFLPAKMLKYSTLYEIKVRSKIRSVNGTSLFKSVSILYATENDPTDISAPNVISIHPNFSATSVTPKTLVTVKFDEKLSELSVQSSIFNLKTIEGSPIAGQISVHSQEITFKPDINLKNNTTYQVVIGPGITDLSGNKMQSRIDWFFTTIKALPSQVDVPLLSTWEANMLSWGNNWGKHHNPNGSMGRDARIGATYYDAQYVFYQIADYTGQKEPWYTYAKHAEINYRNYLGKTFRRAGYWRFPHGFFEDYIREEGATTKDIMMIRDNVSFSHPIEFSPNTGYFGEWASVSRELAYVIQANVIAERARLPRKFDNGAPRLKTFIRFTESQLYEWRTQTFMNPKSGRFAPFMFGLTAHALIEFHEWETANGRDPNAYWAGKHWPTIKDALKDVSYWAFNEATVRAGDNAGQKMWVPSSGQNGGAFRYDDTADGSNDVAYDLNMLIAPVYGWLYKETHDVIYRDMGDQLWIGGVKKACLKCLLGKVYNQNYRTSFDYIRWRNTKK